MQIMTFSQKEETIINENGKEVCTQTKCAKGVPLDSVIDTYTKICGGKWADNTNKLAVSGYETYMNERERERRAASGLQWQSENTSTMIVNLRLLEEVDAQIEKIGVDMQSD